MIIRGANLVDRFYRSDGWTREDVANLIQWEGGKHPKIFYVIPRYFDDRDDEIREKSKFDVLLNDFPYDDADYYAVYSRHRLNYEGHQYKPFTTSIPEAMRWEVGRQEIIDHLKERGLK